MRNKMFKIKQLSEVNMMNKKKCRNKLMTANLMMMNQLILKNNQKLLKLTINFNKPTSFLKLKNLQKNSRFKC